VTLFHRVGPLYPDKRPSYYDIVVNGKTNADAAWHYQNPKPDAEKSRGYVAFSHGVQVDDS
jgi:uncharacterized protein (DUF427 family)